MEQSTKKQSCSPISGLYLKDHLTLVIYLLVFPLNLDRYKEKRYYLPAARSGIMQSHRVIASSLVERATRGGLTPLEVPTFSGIVADFMPATHTLQRIRST